MYFFKRLKLIFGNFNVTEGLKFAFYSFVILISAVCLYFIVFLKILNYFNILNVEFLKNIARIKFSSGSYLGNIIITLLPLFYLSIGVSANNLLNKALERIPEEKLSTTDKRNLYLSGNIDKIFKKGIEVFKKEGMVMFLKKDPLEIKKGVLLLAMILIPLYLLFVL